MQITFMLEPDAHTHSSCSSVRINVHAFKLHPQMLTKLYACVELKKQIFAFKFQFRTGQ